MKIPTLLCLLFTSVLLATSACSSQDEGDTSPLPKQDPQASVDKAATNVQSSTMTPEQKRAATEYLKQGAANAEQMRKSAQTAGAGSK